MWVPGGCRWGLGGGGGRGGLATVVVNSKGCPQVWGEVQGPGRLRAVDPEVSIQWGPCCSPEPASTWSGQSHLQEETQEVMEVAPTQPPRWLVPLRGQFTMPAVDGHSTHRWAHLLLPKHARPLISAHLQWRCPFCTLQKCTSRHRNSKILEIIDSLCLNRPSHPVTLSPRKSWTTQAYTKRGAVPNPQPKGSLTHILHLSTCPAFLSPTWWGRKWL